MEPLPYLVDMSDVGASNRPLKRGDRERSPRRSPTTSSATAPRAADSAVRSRYGRAGALACAPRTPWLGSALALLERPGKPDPLQRRGVRPEPELAPAWWVVVTERPGRQLHLHPLERSEVAGRLQRGPV